MYQEYIVPLSLHRLFIQNKQCFHNQYMHTCLLRATNVYASVYANDSANVSVACTPTCMCRVSLNVVVNRPRFGCQPW